MKFNIKSTFKHLEFKPTIMWNLSIPQQLKCFSPDKTKIAKTVHLMDSVTLHAKCKKLKPIDLSDTVRNTM